MKPQLNLILGKFIESLLRPVAGFCLRRGMKVQEFLEITKRSFLNAAQDELKLSGSEESISRLAVMTGLQRREVSKLKEVHQEAQSDGGLLIRILGQWQQDKRFRDKAGTPKLLSIEGTESDFTALVRSVSKDINPYTVLFELERINAVRREDEKLKLISEVYVPGDNVENALALLASDQADLLLAVEENVFTRPKIPHLHIKTQYDNIALEALEQIRAWFLEQGAKFHEQARNYLSQFDKDLNPRLYDKRGGGRVAVGTFSRIEEDKATTSKSKNDEEAA